MKKYETPKVEVIAVPVSDVIRTSGITGGDSNSSFGGGGNED